ncbi:MAG: amino acid permease [Acidimicrobiia bacterium]|nr:amino acid permease [Acidimicrobiia bacterium]
MSGGRHLRGVLHRGRVDEDEGDGGGGATRARSLGVLGLALVIISAMDSIRNLPTTATFGLACVFFYFLAVAAYLVPVAFTSAELATTFPGDGGVYSWVKEAFGQRWGFLAVWCDWSENIVWFPTVLVFLATTTAYVVDPSLADDKVFLVAVMLIIFWGTTLAAFAGAVSSARWTGVLVTVGTAVPTTLVIALGAWWLISDRPSQIPFEAGGLVPEWEGLASLVYVASIVVAFAGMEIGGYYARNTRRPERTYPLAVLAASTVVAALSILGSLAIAIVVPKTDISLSGGVMQALTRFFDQLGIGAIEKPIGVLIIVGVIGGLSAWAVGPALGMQSVAEEGGLAPFWARKNRRGAPVAVLLIQTVLGTLLSLLLLLVNSVNTYYWMLTALVAQTFIVMYLLMYASVIHLRRTQPDAVRPFRIPGGDVGLYGIVGLGVLGAVFTFVLGFVPANHLSVEATGLYVAVMLFGILAVCVTPFLLHRNTPDDAPPPAVAGTGEPSPAR